MSVAFTKEGDYENGAAVDLPDRPVSPHPNLVTLDGLQQLEAAFALARQDYATHQAVEGQDVDRRALARASRDLRYFSARLASAKLVPAKADYATVEFGALVTFERADGRRQSLRLVGEDEADPKAATVSYVSPLARALMGKTAGDTATAGGAEVEIISVE